MLGLETNVRRIIARLEREGWINIAVAGHYRFVNGDFPGVMIVVPRRKELTIGAAQSIAEAAEWI
ncbi:MAG: type II toxin-antitoxin system HicA family toxin [Methylocella sp.]